MGKIVGWLSLLLLVSLVLISIGMSRVEAAHIGVTAQGNEPGAIPGAPTNFDATLISNYQADITWLMGMNATTTVIRAKIGGYPTDVNDGYLVYDSNGQLTSDWFDLTMTGEPLYYRAWSHNGLGYSAEYAQDYVEGGGVGMTNALILIPLLGLLAGLTIIGDWRRNWLVVILATFGWFLMAGWTMTTSSSTWDAYWIIAILSIGMAIITMVWPLVNRPQELPREEELSDEDSAWGGKAHRAKRNKSKWQGD